MITKICSNCRLEKEETYYTKNDSRPDGFSTYCKECSAIKRKISALKSKGVEIPQELLSQVTTDTSASEKRKQTVQKKYGVDHFSKTLEFGDKINNTTNIKRLSTDFNLDIGKNKRCSSCGVTKSVNKFSVSNYTTDGYRCYCKDCKNLKDRSTRKRTTEGNFIDERATSTLRLETNKLKYGVEHPIQRQEIKEKIIETTLERYGVENYAKCIEFETKRQKTSLDKYGVTNFFKLSNFIDIRSTTCLQKYGKKYPAMSEEYKLDSGIYLVDYLKQTGVLPINYGICRNLYKRFGIDAVNLFIETGSLPYTTTLEEYSSELLSLDYFGKRPEHGFERYPDFKMSDNLYVDVDGLYWHSEAAQKDKKYHYNKRLEYETHNKTLLQFREDEIKYKGDIVKSMIDSMRGITIKVNARECEIKHLDTWKTAADFYDNNHLQGHGATSTNYGLYYKDKLVQVMGFRFRKDKQSIEISRVCTLLGHRVIGGFSKLLKRIEEFTNATAIYSFCDLRYSQGKTYESTGFKLLRESLGWAWTDFNLTYNRLQCIAGEGKTERENAEALGWVKIYDAGQRLYVKYVNQT